MVVRIYVLVFRQGSHIGAASRRPGTHTRGREGLVTLSWAVWGWPDTKGKLGTHSWMTWYVRSFRIIVVMFYVLVFRLDSHIKAASRGPDTPARGTLTWWRAGAHTKWTRGRLGTSFRGTHSRWGKGTHTWAIW